jgi:hypothetical protein
MPETVQTMSEWSTGNTLSFATLVIPVLFASCGVVWRLGQLASAVLALQLVLTRLESSDENLRSNIADLRERVIVLERTTPR